DRTGEGSRTEDARSWRRGSRLSLGAPAAVPEEGEAARGGAAVVVPEGRVDERLRRGAHGAVRRVGEGVVADDDRAAEALVGSGVRRVAGEGLARARVRLLVGGRHLHERA